MDVSRKVFDEMNEVRQNPQGYASKVEALLSCYEGNVLTRDGKRIMTKEGPSAVQECVDFLNTCPSSPALTWSDALSSSAQIHVDDIGPKGITGHNGSDGSTMQSRIEQFCQWNITIGENIDFGKDTGEDIVVALLVDDGVSSRGHRTNIMKEEYRFAGVGFGEHSYYGFLCVIDYAGDIL
ncbi:hypothetical protein SteCoe_16061 [Stentor coeruleus]|uniref:SCP domain-containing protein n=1 Tax=Stentor coeruleus TaxID=5963 RepID=A0A1R2C275_9CILI|nr:hypothetical protein SteCoe_16061 [Stentor coeruleus]